MLLLQRKIVVKPPNKKKEQEARHLFKNSTTSRLVGTKFPRASVAGPLPMADKTECRHAGKLRMVPNWITTTWFLIPFSHLRGERSGRSSEIRLRTARYDHAGTDVTATSNEGYEPAVPSLEVRRFLSFSLFLALTALTNILPSQWNVTGEYGRVWANVSLSNFKICKWRNWYWKQSAVGLR